MKTIDDLIEWLKNEELWQDEFGGTSDDAIATRATFRIVIEKVEELKANMEKNCV